MTGRVHEELDHLFRREAGRLVAILSRALGPSHLDLAEAVVQEALLKAAQTWPFDGIPDNPTGWLMRVARNQAIDQIRRRRGEVFDSAIWEALPDERQDEAAFDSEIRDDQLRLLFACCHPLLAHEARVALALKTLCGFGVSEIARAFLAREEAIAQRLVRAKSKLRAAGVAFEIPAGAELAPRLAAVLDTVYLLFNEGYCASVGDALIREDMCREACRLAALLAAHPVTRAPEVHALAALLFLQASRLGARLDDRGEVLLLAEQDRTRWDQALIGEGLAHLAEAASGESLSDFHLLAGIAAAHATAPSFEETDWRRILGYYDLLAARAPSPVLLLNRAAALSFVDGPRAALTELARLAELPALRGYYLLAATVADCHRRCGEPTAALTQYRHALDQLGETAPGALGRFLQRRMAECTAML